MKRLIFIVGTILALVLLPWMMPSVARADSGVNSFAVGGGTTSRTHFAFSAHQNGTNPATGYAVLNDLGGTNTKIQGPVICLRVTGTSAFFVFEIQHTSDATNFPTGEVEGVSVNDGDLTMEDQRQLDHLGYGKPIPNPNISCPQLLVFLEIIGGVSLPLISGNVVVQDPVTALLPCPSMTDNTTYMIDTSCNLYTNTGTSTGPTWTLIQ